LEIRKKTQNNDKTNLMQIKNLCEEKGILVRLARASNGKL
jgi:hypothetical protein